jgi:hypothetical protein
VTNWYTKPGKGKAFNDGLKKIDAALPAKFLTLASGLHYNQT